MTARAWARRFALALLFVALTLVMLRPHFGRFPSDPGDPSFVAWSMSWTAHAFAHAPRHVLDANIFWPRHATLAYSDLLLPMVPVFAGFHALTGNWENAVTLTDLTLLVVALGSAYALARWVTGRSDVAVFAAIAFALNGYVLAQISHLQLYSLGFVALAFLLLLRMLDAPSAGRAIALAVAQAVVLYAALYYGLIYAVGATVVVGVHVAARRRALDARLTRALVICAGLTAVLVAPAVLGYLHAQHLSGFRRSIDPQWGLRPRDLVTPPPGSYVWRSLARRTVAADAEHRFFAGFSTYALAAFGVLGLALARRGRERDALLLAAAGAAAFVLALGPVVAGRRAPFWLFHDHVPGFGAVRAVARFAVVWLLAVAVLAATGLARLTEGLRGRGRAIVTGVACAVLLAELAAPLRWQGLRHDARTLAVYRLLSRQPPGAVVELPMADHHSPPGAWAGTEAPRMLFSTIDWHPRVNGYSGLNPPGYSRQTAALNSFPAPVALAELARLRVRYVVWHPTGSVLARPLPDLPPDLAAHARRAGNAWLITLS